MGATDFGMFRATTCWYNLSMADLKKQIRDRLQEVQDPELNISIVDLGLVYKIDVDKNKNTRIQMTLTTLGCPLFELIEKEVREKLEALNLNEVKIELTFDPPWTMDRMSERAKAMLGI